MPHGLIEVELVQLGSIYYAKGSSLNLKSEHYFLVFSLRWTFSVLQASVKISAIQY